MEMKHRHLARENRRFLEIQKRFERLREEKATLEARLHRFEASNERLLKVQAENIMLKKEKCEWYVCIRFDDLVSLELYKEL
jgi:hypothetical protein